VRKEICLIAVVSFLGFNGLSYAAMAGCGSTMRLAQAKAADESIEKQKAVDAGNKICPISQEAIDEKLKSVYEYEGKIYNFCCAMCIDDFKKDPEKYISKIEEEKTKEAAAENAPHPQEEGPGHMHD